MWFITLKGSPGCGKSTVGRALSRRLGWPLIDKDDIKDILDEQVPDSGRLAYATMFNIARRQLLQELNVICDSPLNFSVAYEKARSIARETGATLAIVECRCSDPQEWQWRIDGRKELHLPPHHQTDWQALQAILPQMHATASYPIIDPHLIVDTVRPLAEIVDEIVGWLGQQSGQ
ncbi:MAG TPA: AAA family ATPase [Ktedonobacteraceae bacterium]|nr:AAA family ATPase [Ktedonobacteraceae bacterium]